MSSHLRGRDARELSLGERQLVFLAVAVAQAAPILILDEPTAHLDIRHQVEVMELLVGAQRARRPTMVAVLHDLALAAHFFPRDRHGRRPDRRRRAPRTSLSERSIRDVFGVDPALVRLPVAVG